jgi:hypothetical protein
MLTMPKAPLVLAARTATLSLVMAAAAQLAGCAATTTQINSDPAGAQILVNDTAVGAAPVTYEFDFSKSPTTVLKAVKPGYFDEELSLTSHNASDKIKDGQLLLSLDEDQSFKVTTSSDAVNNWLRIQVDTNLDKDAMWQKLVDAVTSRYPSLEMIDNNSGYLRSVYISRKFKSRDGEFEIRTRFVGSIASKSPLVYKIKVESELRGGTEDWKPFQRIFVEDQQLVEEVQSRLGVG